jgi:Spy/CpxP family protein refolding chaperone
MKTCIKATFLAVTCATFLSLQFSAAAGPGKPDREHRRDGATTKVLERLSQKLDLTDEQKVKIAAILAATGEELKGEAGNAKDVLQKSREEIAAVLNDEQKKKLGEMKQNVREGVGGFAKAHGPQMKEHMQSAGEEMRLRTALSSLELSDEQREKLRAVQQEVMEKRREIHEAIRPKIEALQKEAKEKVTSVLTDDQKAQLEKKMLEMPKPDESGRRFRGPEGKAPDGTGTHGDAGSDSPFGGPQKEGHAGFAGGGDALLMELFR